MPPKDGGEWTIEELKECAVLLLIELIQNEVDLSKAVPHAAFAARGKILASLPLEKVKEELHLFVKALEEQTPEEKRKEVLLKFVEHLQEAKHSLEFTKERIDRRVQPEGQERSGQPFQSFCKRKKLKEW